VHDSFKPPGTRRPSIGRHGQGIHLTGRLGGRLHTGRNPGPGHGLGDGGILFGWYGDSDGFDGAGPRPTAPLIVVSHRPAPPEATDKQTFWGPLGLPDSPFFALSRLLSAAVWGEDPDLTPPRPPAYAEDGGDLCYVKDCGRAIALLMLAERLNHGTYNVSTGRRVRNSEVVAAINAAVPAAKITLPRGRNPGRPPDNYLDTTRLRQDTGFRPEYDVERAVPDYVGWLTSHPR